MADDEICLFHTFDSNVVLPMMSPPIKDSQVIHMHVNTYGTAAGLQLIVRSQGPYLQNGSGST